MTDVRPREGGPTGLFCYDCGRWITDVADWKMREEGKYDYTHNCRIVRGERKFMGNVGKKEDPKKMAKRAMVFEKGILTNVNDNDLWYSSDYSKEERVGRASRSIYMELLTFINDFEEKQMQRMLEFHKDDVVPWGVLQNGDVHTVCKDMGKTFLTYTGYPQSPDGDWYIWRNNDTPQKFERVSRAAEDEFAHLVTESQVRRNILRQLKAALRDLLDE